MSRISIPPEAIKLAALERRISDDLTLNQIDEISTQIYNETTEKTAGLSRQLIDKLQQKREKLVEKKIAQLDIENNLLAKIEQLSEILPDLTPLETDLYIQEIEQIASLSSTTDAKMVAIARQKLDCMRFEEAAAIPKDLHALAAKMREVGKMIEETQSPALLSQFFNERQIAEIYRAGREI